MSNMNPERRSVERIQALDLRPQPPEDVQHMFKDTTYKSFYSYLEARTYDDWTVPDLRLLAQIALLDDMIFAGFGTIAEDGITSIGSQGQDIPHPASTTMNKALMAQGSLLRKLGIGIAGMTRPQAMKTSAEQQAKITKIENQPKYMRGSKASKNYAGKFLA